MKSLKIIVIAALLSALGANLAVARHHGGPDGMRSWVSRDGLMHLISDQRAILTGMVEGTVPDNRREFVRAANALSTMFAMIPSVFEKNDMPAVTRAKAEIWTDWDGFVATANAQSLVATGIANTAALGGLDAGKAKVGDIDCGSCHTPYRGDAPE
jgi:cytochrome c556